MKKLSCDLCDFEASSETFEEWMNALKPHYGEAHADVIQGKMHLADEQKQAEMKQWMASNRARFEAAPEA